MKEIIKDIIRELLKYCKENNLKHVYYRETVATGITDRCEMQYIVFFGDNGEYKYSTSSASNDWCGSFDLSDPEMIPKLKKVLLEYK